MIYLLFCVLILPLIVIGIWFVIVTKQSDERYERELDRIYGRKR